MTRSSPVVVAAVPPPAAPPQARVSTAARPTTPVKRVDPPIMRTLYSLWGALPPSTAVARANQLRESGPTEPPEDHPVGDWPSMLDVDDQPRRAAQNPRVKTRRVREADAPLGRAARVAQEPRLLYHREPWPELPLPRVPGRGQVLQRHHKAGRASQCPLAEGRAVLRPHLELRHAIAELHDEAIEAALRSDPCGRHGRLRAPTAALGATGVARKRRRRRRWGRGRRRGR